MSPDSAQFEAAGNASIRLARMWVDAYRELIRLERELLVALVTGSAKLGEDASHEAQMTDIPLVRSHLTRSLARVQLWDKRLRELEAQR